LDKNGLSRALISLFLSLREDRKNSKVIASGDFPRRFPRNLLSWWTVIELYIELVPRRLFIPALQ
jgi:hypothetical protein